MTPENNRRKDDAPWDGETNRRKTISLEEKRLILLELTTEANKRGVEKANERLSQFDHEWKAEVRILGENIVLALDEKQKKCDVCREETDTEVKELFDFKNLIVVAFETICIVCGCLVAVASLCIGVSK